jgi:hypothetical protein
LKSKLYETTNVDPGGQKWMGIKYKQNNNSDESSVENLICAKKQGKYGVFMLTGVPSNQVYHNNELRFLNE